MPDAIIVSFLYSYCPCEPTGSRLILFSLKNMKIDRYGKELGQRRCADLISMSNWGGYLGVNGRYQVGGNKNQVWWRNLFADSVGFVLAE